MKVCWLAIIETACRESQGEGEVRLGDVRLIKRREWIHDLRGKGGRGWGGDKKEESGCGNDEGQQ